MPNLHLSSCLSSRCSEVCSTDGCESHQDEDPVTKFSLGLITRGWLLEPGRPTLRISSSSMQPLTSVLLAKTSRLAPESRFSIVSLCLHVHAALHHRASDLFLEQTVEFVHAVFDSQAVGRVHHPDKRIRLLKVVSPVRSQSLLAANVPLVRSALRAVTS